MAWHLSSALQRKTLPTRGGAGLKPAHIPTILSENPDIGFFEIHAENYLGAGGPPHSYLTAVRERYPLSIHGVGLSIGGSTPVDRAHLDRVAALCARYEPAVFSEHLAWSTHDGRFLNDLLPLPYTRETLSAVCDHVDEVQEALRRRVLIENPSTYLTFGNDEFTETAFLGELARRTGCGLLFDVNNMHVSCTNSGAMAADYLEAFPWSHVDEVHLAGHDVRSDEEGRPLLVDTHDRAIAETVWCYYADAIARTGPIATLIEWDAMIPDFATLAHEVWRAEWIMASVTGHSRAAA